MGYGHSETKTEGYKSTGRSEYSIEFSNIAELRIKRKETYMGDRPFWGWWKYWVKLREYKGWDTYRACEEKEKKEDGIVIGGMKIDANIWETVIVCNRKGSKMWLEKLDRMIMEKRD